MCYVYTSKDEEEYYTKWRKDLEKNAYKADMREALIRIARNLAEMGINIDDIATITNLLRKKFCKVLKETTSLKCTDNCKLA